MRFSIKIIASETFFCHSILVAVSRGILAPTQPNSFLTLLAWSSARSKSKYQSIWLVSDTDGDWWNNEDISGDEKSALLSQIKASRPSILPVKIDKRNNRSVDGRSYLFKSRFLACTSLLQKFIFCRRRILDSKNMVQFSFYFFKSVVYKNKMTVFVRHKPKTVFSSIPGILNSHYFVEALLRTLITTKMPTV